MLSLDDESIRDDDLLIRGVRREWVVSESGMIRLSSAAFKDSSREISCFVEREVGGLNGFQSEIRSLIEVDLNSSLSGVALVKAQDFRVLGYWIERRPREFHENAAHVVICSPAAWARKQSDRAAKALSSAAQFIPDVPAEFLTPH